MLTGQVKRNRLAVQSLGVVGREGEGWPSGQGYRI